MIDLRLKARDMIVRYLMGELPLEALRGEVASLAWSASNLDEGPSELIGELELTLAEHISGHWTAEELRRRLVDLVETTVVVVGEPSPVSFAASASIVRTPVTVVLRSAGAGTRIAVVPG